VDESLDTLVLLDGSARPRALRERARLRLEGRLQLGEHRRTVLQLLARALVALVVVLQVPRRQQDLALTRGDRALLIAHAATAARRLLLREAPLERLYLHHEQIGFRALLVILGDRVIRDEVARHETMLGIRRLRLADLLEAQQRLVVRVLCAGA